MPDTLTSSTNYISGTRHWTGVPAAVDVVERSTAGGEGIVCPNTVRVNGVELYNPPCDPVVVERVERIVAGVPTSSAARLTLTALAFCTVAGAPGSETPALLGDGTAGGAFELVFPAGVDGLRWTPGVGDRLWPALGVFVNDREHSIGLYVSSDDPVVVGAPVDPGIFFGRAHGVEAEPGRMPLRVTLTLLCERLVFEHEPALSGRS